LHAGYAKLGELSFSDYQSRINAVLERFATQLGWKILQVPSAERSGDTARRIAALLADSGAVGTIDVGA
jgi:hypothetical protein